jgi:hypothetical protein
LPEDSAELLICQEEPMTRFARPYKLLLLCCVTLVLAVAAHGQRSGKQEPDLIGTYTHGGRYASSAIAIEPDGRYHTNSSDCTQEYYEAGTYSFKTDVICFVITKRTVKSHGETDDQAKNLLDPKVYREMYHEELTAEARKEELIPVKWGERLYLMPKEYLIEFCNAINLGLEPRKSLGTDWYLGSSYLRNGDENKKVSGPPSLSSDLIDLLLEKPVEGEIINIEREGETKVAIINRGSEAGLKPGMRMVSTKPGFWDGPSLWSGLVVISATYNLARLKVLEDVKLGDKVSSKYVPRDY